MVASIWEGKGRDAARSGGLHAVARPPRPAMDAAPFSRSGAVAAYSAAALVGLAVGLCRAVSASSAPLVLGWLYSSIPVAWGGRGAWRPICLPVVQNGGILCVSPNFSPFPLNNVKHIALLSSFWPELLVWGADGLGFAMESNPRGLPACGSDVQPCLPWCRPPP